MNRSNVRTGSGIAGGRLAAALVAVIWSGLIACGVTGSPATYEYSSVRPLPDTFQCISDDVANSGFEILRDREDAGILRAIRQGIVTDTVADAVQGRRVRRMMEWQLLEVEILQGVGDRLRVEYTVASGADSRGPWGEPSTAIASFARDVAERCS